MSKEIEKKHHQTFENLKHVNNDGMEFRFARELQAVLGYTAGTNSNGSSVRR